MISDVNDVIRFKSFVSTHLSVTSEQLKDPSPLHDVDNVLMDKSLERKSLSLTSGQLKSYTKVKKITHLYFLRTPKGGSTTVSTLLGRFGYLNNLTFVLPNPNTYYIPLEKENGYLQEPKGEKYDLLIDHSRYNRGVLQRILPRDTKYIGLIREPLARFISAFIFIRHAQKVDFAVKIPGKDTNAAISWYLKNAANYTRKPGVKDSILNNLMISYFGFPIKEKKNANDRIIEEFLERIDAEFDLIIVLEYLDESLLLLKRMMFWSMKDIMYVKPLNTAIINKEDVLNSLTEDDRQRHKRHEFLDFALYRYFLKQIRRKILSEGMSFQKELEDYRSARAVVSKFCENHEQGEELQYTTKNFKEHFKVNFYDCYLMNIELNPLREMIRLSKRYPEWPLERKPQ
ncbi:hypothetical protein FSP39_009436 [Pinctada imbricata]|uniref:Uncharacterized protein n=1 Tax=Pinctada imbricata TaxID=66713 RepID=A0AA89BRM2_PINIB|nr:hypothetical protein FSP39_009436 [Pinctada imbricata]